MRVALLVLVTLLTAACTDLRDFRGRWAGMRVGESPVLRVGPGERMALTITRIDEHGIAGTLQIDGLLEAIAFESVAGAEADVLASLTFAGAPLRVYVATVADTFVLVALYDDPRIEARVLRGGGEPVYAIFALEPAPT